MEMYDSGPELTPAPLTKRQNLVIFLLSVEEVPQNHPKDNLRLLLKGVVPPLDCSSGSGAQLRVSLLFAAAAAVPEWTRVTFPPPP